MTRILATSSKSAPKLRNHELNENSTRYDLFAAAPPDEEMVKYWFSWAGIALICGVFVLVVFAGVLSSKKVRRKPFNLYLVYLMIPDFVFSLACGLTCLINGINQRYLGHWMCNLQQFYIVFGIGANAWLNAVIALQIHTMLRYSHGRRRYRIPSRRRVTLHALAVYAWVAFLGSWGTYENENFPFHSGLANGMACVPQEIDEASTLFFWLVFFPLFVGIPIVYVIWVSWDIHYRKLLPPTGKRRLLTVYFGRLLLVFLVMWIPSLVLMFAIAPPSPMFFFAGGSWSHLQGGVSGVVSLLKPDIRDAVKRFLTCRCCQQDNEKTDTRKSEESRDTPSTDGPDLSSRSARPRQGSTGLGLPSSYFLKSSLCNSTGDKSLELELEVQMEEGKLEQQTEEGDVEEQIEEDDDDNKDRIETPQPIGETTVKNDDDDASASKHHSRRVDHAGRVHMTSA